MKYLKEYLSHINEFTDDEFQDILDMFQDIIDEYSLVRLNQKDYGFLQDLLKDISKQHSYAIVGYPDIISVYINYRKSNEFTKNIFNFKRRLINIGYSVQNTSLDWHNAVSQLESFTIRKNFSSTKNESSIDKYRVGNVPLHEFDLDILKDIFNELRDKFDVELAYNKIFSDIDSRGNDTDRFCWCTIKCHEEDNGDVEQDIDDCIYRTLEHYYRETGKELTAYIARGTYDGFYGNHILNLLICFTLKIDSSNMVKFSSFSAINKIYQRRIMKPSDFTSEDIENIMDTFRDLRDEYDIDHIDFDINSGMRISYNLFYTNGTGAFYIVKNIEDEFKSPHIVTDKYCLRLIFPFDESAFVYPYDREKELVIDIKEFVKRLELMGYYSNYKIVECDYDNSIDEKIHIEYIDIDILKNKPNI